MTATGLTRPNRMMRTLDSGARDSTALCACCGVSFNPEDAARNFEEDQALWPEEEEDEEEVEDAVDLSSADEWLCSLPSAADVHAAGQHLHDYERFSRDGVSWYWVSDALGRPIAVPDNMASVPALARAHREVNSVGAEDVSDLLDGCA